MLLMLGLLIGLAFRHRRAKAVNVSEDTNLPLTGDSVRINSAVKKLRIAVIVMPLLLVNGLWVTRGAPLLPRLVGVAINLLFTAYFVFLLRKVKKTGSAR